MRCLDIIQLVISLSTFFAAVIIGACQICLAKQMKDFEARQNSRDEKRRKDEIYAEATKFIQKYNNIDHSSEIYLLPLCVSAYLYNPIYSYRREIYREFCGLTEEVQNEVLNRCELNIKSFKRQDFYNNIITQVKLIIEKYYQDDRNIFDENDKYLERALIHHGHKEIPKLTCAIDNKESIKRNSKYIVNKDDNIKYEEHITNLLAYHKKEKPISKLFSEPTNMGSPDSSSTDEIVISYLYCMIATYSTIYNLTNFDDFNHNNNIDDFCDTLYMEDMFLRALYEILIYCYKEE